MVLTYGGVYYEKIYNNFTGHITDGYSVGFL